MEICYEDLIEYILDDMELNYIRRDSYYLTQNPLTELDNHPSFQWFTNDGFGQSYNSDINGKNRLNCKEICSLTGYLDDYIRFICEQNNIPYFKVNQYKDLIIKKQLKEYYNYYKYKDFVNLFGSLYLSQADILGISNLKPIDKKRIHKAKRKKSKTKIVELECNEEQYQQCKEYIEGRGLEFIKGKIEPIRLKMVSDKYTFENNAIAIRHEDNHIKYRLIDSKMRYISSGCFSTPYKAIDNGNKTLVFIEGQFESEVFAKFSKGVDVYAMANTNSMGDLSHIEKYDKIIVVVDFDTFKKVEQGLTKQLNDRFSDKEIIVTYKFETKNKEDYNDLLKKDLNLLKKSIDNVINM